MCPWSWCSYALEPHLPVCRLVRCQLLVLKGQYRGNLSTAGVCPTPNQSFDRHFKPFWLGPKAGGGGSEQEKKEHEKLTGSSLSQRTARGFPRNERTRPTTRSATCGPSGSSFWRCSDRVSDPIGWASESVPYVSQNQGDSKKLLGPSLGFLDQCAQSTRGKSPSFPIGSSIGSSWRGFWFQTGRNYTQSTFDPPLAP